MTRYPDTRLFIDGDWRDGSGTPIDVLNPATGASIGSLAHALAPDLDTALAAAERGFATWSATAAVDRAALMRRASALLSERAESIARLMVLEQGKPLAQALAETQAATGIIEWFAEEARRSYGQVIPPRDPAVLQMTLKGPVGPVAAFTPWNFPINQMVRKLAAALAAGCSIIVKAPEETPASPAALVQCFADAGLPRGVVGLVYGVPADISGHLIASPVIRKISFTGSTAVGKHLAALAGAHMKRVTMELGGHAPVLVFDDADVDHAAAQMVTHKFRNAGQVCVSPTRFLVQDTVFDRFTDRFTQLAEQVRVGDGMSPETEMGPLANDRRIPAIESMVADAIGKGAALRSGGRRLGNVGWFYTPTVLTDVPASARIMNEEPFGPVALINRFSAPEEAIAEANRLPYGLAAYGYAKSAERIALMRDRLRAGMLTVNHLGLALPELPFGGIMDSGYGTEGGSEALEAYLETRLFTCRGG